MNLEQALLATWPPHALHPAGPWQVAEGRGGGKRVSCATGDGGAEDVALAEKVQDALGQPRLFMLRQGQEMLDQTLAERGYDLVDPTCLYAVDPQILAASAPEWLTSFPHWPPLAVACDIWGRAGIGPDRMAVMARATGPKAVILGRAGDRPAGVGFVAIAGGIAMLHAVEVAHTHRRRGLGANILRAAGAWAVSQSAQQFSLAVTSANLPARALYDGMGMQCVGQYHYRLATGPVPL
jgi:GNAT superfamily N-acetyltransferase